MDQSFLEQVRGIVSRDERYPSEAYAFVMEALGHTQKIFARGHHISGEELVEGSAVLAVKKFGPLAWRVCSFWGISSTEDLGRIVFNMVDAGVLARRDEDTFDSFSRGVVFEEELVKKYARQLEGAARKFR
jgi:uncharacterized repeat protein (TIGR04138 family)